MFVTSTIPVIWDIGYTWKKEILPPQRGESFYFAPFCVHVQLREVLWAAISYCIIAIYIYVDICFLLAEKSKRNCKYYLMQR